MKLTELTNRQKQVLLTVAAAELALKAYAAHDLMYRPAEQVRGPKALWGLALLVNLFGPLAYLGVGRR